MTNEQIKKALECCAEWIGCESCPYFGRYRKKCTSGRLHTDALNLIAEQEKEIEQLKAENKQRAVDYDILYTRCTKRLKQAKIEVLNELKEKCKFDGHTVAVYKNDIEQMIEELKK